MQAIETTTGISQYEKASRIMGNVNRHLNAALKEGDKARYFVHFCEKLEKQGNDFLTEISKEMIAKCYQSASMNNSTCSTTS